MSPTTRERRPGAGAAQDLADSRIDTEVTAATPLDVARDLTRAGVPVFVARQATNPDGTWRADGGTGGCGYWFPKGWESTPADPTTLDAYNPGDALGAVMGHHLDLLDVDPRNGGDDSRAQLVEAGMWPTVYAAAATPSGGTHEFITPLGAGSRDGVRPGLDVKGGRPDGAGRGFAFIAPTVRLSKVTGKPVPYTWTTEPMMGELNPGDDSGEALGDLVRQTLAPASTTAAASANPFATPTQHTGPIPVGKRHDRLVSYAGYLLHRGVGLDLAETLMGVRWADCEDKATLPEQEALAKLRDVYNRYEAGAPDRAAPGEAAPDDITFWESRESLATIHGFARARMVAPWSLLGAVLARVVASTPPWIVLPALVGGHASLNLFIALVGASGAGKGATAAAAIDAVTVQRDPHTITVGSGEGLAAAYVHREKGVLIRDHDEVLATIPEVDTLAALGSRNGATLLPTLRSAWSGEALGHAYVDPAKRLPVAAHTYRLALVAGVQPARAGALLDDTDGGTPQRFVWVPTTDPDAPDEAGAEPPPWVIPTSPWHATTGRRVVLRIPDAAANTIRAARAARLRGDGDALDGHALLCRLKVAAALALLDGARQVRDEDWELSATVMAVSDVTRTGVVRHLAAAAGEANEARGRAEGVRASVAGETADELAVKRVGRGIVARLRETSPQTASDIRRGVAQRDRGHFGATVEALTAAGVIARTEVAGGVHLAIVEAVR